MCKIGLPLGFIDEPKIEGPTLTAEGAGEYSKVKTIWIFQLVRFPGSTVVSETNAANLVSRDQSCSEAGNGTSRSPIQGCADYGNVDVAANHQSHCRTSDPNGTTDPLEHWREAKQLDKVVGLLLKHLLIG